ncbi:hypothetical protein FE784_30380 [Paenibacillus hemerocallicola]|uniref:Uncharacterized protein n=1 Tax=Paenibacillus hemerocallicola TaxID=1172614 RepID=A0A5C4T0J9_9BACL|nr:hypothetical protein [Paenibacillus hemerocallicola]TNJ62476.1 hypothetical protein FE784_30380 [Paenibacillus hemerocallicola]
MVHAFIIEPIAYNAFEDETAQLEQCKEWGLLSEKAIRTKSFLYKGNGANLTCSIVGYVDKLTAVIELDNGQRHCIHPAYLKEMQASSFGRRITAAAEAETEDAEPDVVLEEASTPEEAKSEPATVDETESEAMNTEEVQVEEAPKGKTSKKKADKLQLPEDKVKMTATVQEFTTVPNNFSDNDDEVIIYEAVSIADPEIEVGVAWSSHSATLKKLELAVGDTITFEGKIVAKKLTKHPVPYKINNPAKIQKQST